MDASKTSSSEKFTACDKCKSLKVRCVRADAQTTCLKCLKSGHSCLTTPVRKEPSRPRRRRLRLADLNEKLQGILENLEPAQDARSNAGPTSASRLSQKNGHQANGIERSPVSIDHGLDSDMLSMSERSSMNWASRLDLKLAVIQDLLNRYRAMQHHFPFVVIEPEWSASDLLRTRPFLLLAAATNAASHNPDIQEKLARELKDIFAQHVLVAGVTSLDLLQGLTLHLAWAQYYLIPRSQQAFKYMQMAISMLVDLGLDDDPETVRHERPDIYMRSDNFRSYSHGTSQISLEAQRAALGCYYLSSIISASMSRPNTLTVSGSVLSRAVALDDMAECDTDRQILPLMQYQRITEVVREAYKAANRTDDPPDMSLLVCQLNDALDSWWNALPEQMQAIGLFLHRYHAAQVHIHEMGFLFHFRKTAPTPSPSIASTTIETNLTKCVNAIKQHLDVFLALDINGYNDLPLEEWSRLVISFFILYKLSVGSKNVPGWNTKLCRNIIDLETYLTSAARRIRCARPSLESTQPLRDELFFVLPVILETARNSYVLTRDAPSLVGPGHRVHIDLSRSRQPIAASAQASAARCPAMRFWNNKAVDFDRNSDWYNVNIAQHTHPAEQLAKNDHFWNEILNPQDDEDL